MHRRLLPHTSDIKRTYDVVIIGGGVQGLSLAYHLAAAGRRDVAVFERSYIGAGASGRNLALTRSNYSSPEWTRLYGAARAAWDTISAELDFNIMVTTRGYVMCAETASVADIARSAVAQQSAMGVPTRYLSAAEVRELVPGIRSELIAGAQYDPTAAVSRHDATVWGYANAAARLGVRIHAGVEVIDVTVERDRAVGIVTTKGKVAAGAIVNCAGSGSAAVGRMSRVTVPTVTLPLEAFVTDAHAPFIDPVVSLLEAQCYMQQTGRGEFVCGAEIAGATGDQLVTTHQWLRHAARQYVRFFPALANVRVVRCWAGLVDMSPDGSGLAGEVAERPGFYVLCGWGGYGYMVSPVSGRLMAKYLTTGVMPPLLEPFSFSRLAEGRVLKEKFTVVDFAGETRTT